MGNIALPHLGDATPLRPERRAAPARVSAHALTNDRRDGLGIIVLLRHEAAADHLPPSDPGWLSARRAARRPHRAGPHRAGIRQQPAGAGLPVPAREALAVLQLRLQRPQTRLPGDRLTRRRRQRRLDLAQPAPRVLHHGLVHLQARRHRRVLDGRPRQLPHHARHARRQHRGRPRPRPHGHRVTTPGTMRSRADGSWMLTCPAPPRQPWRNRLMSQTENMTPDDNLLGQTGR